MRITTTLAAAIALGASALATPAAHAAPEGGGVSSGGHVCGTDVGPEPACTVKSTSRWRYGGVGPFSIVAKNRDGSVAWRKSCATGAVCESTNAVIPARKKVTVKVTGPSGNVGFGSPT